MNKSWRGLKEGAVIEKRMREEEGGGPTGRCEPERRREISQCHAELPVHTADSAEGASITLHHTSLLIRK